MRTWREGNAPFTGRNEVSHSTVTDRAVVVAVLVFF